MTELSMSGRAAFIGLDARAMAALKAARPTIDRTLPSSLDTLYQLINQAPEAAGKFEGGDAQTRARTA
ncbi:protoglobin domain-containing protein [Alkalicaulis satelles]|nr:protoglobin domain-containing protein [Alkalicaulis satelles]